VNELFMHLERLTTDFCIGFAPAPLQSETTEGTTQEERTKQQQALDADHGLGLAAKVNVIRLILAYAISLMLHFQLLAAAEDSFGVLDETGLKHVVFLYCRLQTLLLPEERKKVDQAMCITCEPDDVFRTEVNRFRLNVDPDYTTLIGMANAYRDQCPEDGSAIAPAPKIVMVLLTFALQRPMDKPWGYNSRSFNLYWRSTEAVMRMTMNLESLIQSPTPLPYLQHCRLLFVIFVVANPLSIDSTKGWFVNVVLPVVLFWAIRGFQILSKRLENPLGNDEADLNLYDKLASCEVNAEHAFNLTADTYGDIRNALQWTEQWVVTGETPPVASGPPPLRKKEKSFRCYFRWTPIPTLMLKGMFEDHGEVDVLHARRLTFSRIFCGIQGTRKALRRVLWRMDGDRLYQPVKRVADEDDFHFNSDPRFYCHYLQFIGSLKSDDQSTSGVMTPYDTWLSQAIKLLGKQPAATLLSPINEEDSERSVMMQPLRSLRAPSNWERLS